MPVFHTSVLGFNSWSADSGRKYKSLGTCHPNEGPGLDFLFLALDCPRPSHCMHLGNESRRELCLPEKERKEKASKQANETWSKSRARIVAQ